MHTPTVHVIACGALANELVALKSLNNWDHFKIDCIPAKYHSTPALIPDAVKAKITNIQKKTPEDEILVAYGECGTMGMLDKVLDETGVKRLPGAHCYQFFAGQEEFNGLHEAEIGTFYLTDFLTQHFETYVWKMLGLDRKPELLEMYFGNYKKLIYLAQTENAELTAKGEECANRLGLEYERIFTAYGEMGTELEKFVTQNITFHNNLNLEKNA
jgi:hypothetical protein